MLKVGVFGIGHLGKFHLNNWKEIQDVELVGFYDPSDNNASLVADQYGLTRERARQIEVKVITKLRDFLRDSL